MAEEEVREAAGAKEVAETAIAAEVAEAAEIAEETESPEADDVLKIEDQDDLVLVKKMQEGRDQIVGEIKKVIIGQEDIIDELLIALFAGGHCLVTGVPGLAKTLLIKTVADILQVDFSRIQFTPDLMPADVVGSEIVEEENGKRSLKFVRGPIFTCILLADEINRTPPKTQSSLLEAMEEKQVTAAGTTYPMKKPFFVLATQNPIELEGTFPLPEAQLDRFLLRVRMGYPTEAEDALILDRFMRDNPIEELIPVLSADELVVLQGACREVTVEADVREYISKLTQASRNHPQIELGASPRAMLGLLHASQALAAVRGRGYVIPDDVKTLVPAVFEHRISLQAQSNLRGDSVAEVLREIVNSVAAPVESEITATAASGD